MTNLDVDDADDPRIRLVQETFDPRDFPASAASLCRDERIVVAGRRAGHDLLQPDRDRAGDHRSTTSGATPACRDYDRYRFAR